MRAPDETTLNPAQLQELAALDQVLAGEPVEEDYLELQALVASIRKDAPSMEPTFAAALDEKVAAGFPRRTLKVLKRGPFHGTRARLGTRSANRPRRPSLAMLATASSVVVATGALVVGAGIFRNTHVAAGTAGSSVASATNLRASGRPGKQSSSVDNTQTPGPTTPSQPSSTVSGGSATPSTVTPDALQANGVVSADHSSPATGSLARQVQQDATLTLAANRGQVQDLSDRVVAVCDRFAGIVQSSNVSTDDQGGSQATLSLLLPSAQLNSALAALSHLGHVSARTQNTLDITNSYDAAGGRLKEARAQRDGLLRQLAAATTPNQTQSIHDQLAIIAGRISQDQRAVNSLTQKAHYATLSVTITESRQGASFGGGSSVLDDALTSALHVLAVALSVGIVVLAALIPVILVVATAWATALTLRRRRRQQALEV